MPFVHEALPPSPSALEKARSLVEGLLPLSSVPLLVFPAARRTDCSCGQAKVAWTTKHRESEPHVNLVRTMSEIRPCQLQQLSTQPNKNFNETGNDEEWHLFSSKAVSVHT